MTIASAWSSVLLLGTCFSAFAADTPVPVEPWQIELVASSPQVRHPSVVCAIPDGRLLVAEDPMDITAPADATLGRLLCLHPDGHWTVFATNLHAVFGLQYLEGKVYALHNPKLTVFTDDQGVGVERVDLIEQTHPNPWALDWNDHVPANFRLGMDGYFYLAVGDKGLFGCTGRDGSRINLRGGGIVRLRPDATRLEVFATGVRNILDVALDDEDELFTYDNTDEHQWMGRLTHMLDGGFYGYPYDFIPRRPYTLWMMHDFGAGAACGAFAYTEDALPAEFHGNLFLSDFGKRQVFRVRIERDGATFRVAGYEDLFREIPDDFRPVGIAPGPDGLSIYICDWQHQDVKAQAEVGRLWRLRWKGAQQAQARPSWYLPVALGGTTAASPQDLVRGLAHPARSVRLAAQRLLSSQGERSNAAERQTGGAEISRLLRDVLRNSTNGFQARGHALWALAQVDRSLSARQTILEIAQDPDPHVARQALRLLGGAQLREPAPDAEPVLQRQLQHTDPSIRFHAATALGRLALTSLIPALQERLTDHDPVVRFAAFTALRRIGDAHTSAWPLISQGLASPQAAIREGSGFALRGAFSPVVITALVRMIHDGQATPEAREAAVRALAGLHRQFPEWRGDWWAYHPAKAPAPEPTVAWEGTASVIEALRDALRDPLSPVRVAAIEGLATARDTNSAPTFRRLLIPAEEPDVRQAALSALAQFGDSEAGPLIADLLRETKSSPEWLGLAIRRSTRFAGPEITRALADVVTADGLDLSTRRAAATALGERRDPGAVAALSSVLPSGDETLGLAAIEALGRIGGAEANRILYETLRSPSTDRRRFAVRALGGQRSPDHVASLLHAFSEPNTRTEALTALAQYPDTRALDAYLEGLASMDAAVREQCRKALGGIQAKVLGLIEDRAPSIPAIALAELRRVYADDAAARRGPLFKTAAPSVEPAEYEHYALTHDGDTEEGRRLFADERGVACARCHTVGGTGGAVGPDLTFAGTQFSRAQLIESVLYPSRAVRDGYQQIIVETRDGETVSGALKADVADGLTLVDSAGHTNFVARANIANRESSSPSLMPEGLQLGLTLGQFADLIGYLQSCRGTGTQGPRRAPVQPASPNR